MQKPTEGQQIAVQIYGKHYQVIVVKVHPFGTLDVQTNSGRRFRLSGFSFI